MCEVQPCTSSPPQSGPVLRIVRRVRSQCYIRMCEDTGSRSSRDITDSEGGRSLRKERTKRREFSHIVVHDPVYRRSM